MSLGSPLESQTGNANADVWNVEQMFGAGTFYRIPSFQRVYGWKKEKQLESYWDALSELSEKDLKNKLFLGTVVLRDTDNKKGSHDFTVIDGQQRLTTLYLTVLAMLHCAKKNEWDDVIERLTSLLLFPNYVKKNRGAPRIMLSLEDRNQFREILEKVGLEGKIDTFHGEKDKWLTKAFDYLQGKVDEHVGTGTKKKQKQQLEELMENLLENVEAVVIEVGGHYDINEIFDRLNTQGLPLRLLDLARNEIFVRVDLSEVDDVEHVWTLFQQKLQQVWSHGDANASDDDVKASDKDRMEDGFFHPYAIIKDDRVKKNNLFADLTKYHWHRKKGTEEVKRMVEDMSRYVPPYIMLRGGYFPKEANISEDLQRVILRMREKMLPNSAYPFFMQVLREVMDGYDSEKAVKIFETVETFLVRRSLAGHELAGLTPGFKKLWEKNDGIKNLDGLANNMQTRNIKFPDDEEVEKYILNGAIYGRDVTLYVLKQYEEHVTKDSREQIKSIKQDLNIDHMLSLSEAGSLVKSGALAGDDEKYVHTLGNLFLMGNDLNRFKSNASYKDFRKDGLKHAKFQSTKQTFEENEDWGVKEITARSKRLAKWVNEERWKQPKGV